ncbi:homeobox-domain-containing protein [Trametes elegans]|nr:homeobox-domain-containing protein [Trametes elegans]
MSLSSLAVGVKQRRKRSRTTPEQLAKLEEYFAMDQSPTSARRRDIARELGLDERQTQIWFQNRRAKVKMQAKMRARTVEKLEPPPESPPPLTSGFDADMHHLIHEDDEVTIVPCTDLTIGTWRRVASPQHDLIAYTCEARRCITWFIRSGGLSFKMEVPFDIIAEARFLNVSPGVGSATFLLDRPPTFYVEKFSEPAPGADSVRYWQVSGDWTENRQATAVLRHCLMGPAYQLSHLLNNISPSGTLSEVSLYTPTASISDAGSSPEVYSRSCDSPVDHFPHTSTMVLRKPSSLSSLRMLHHPSLERLRPSRHASVPMFHSPLSASMSTPNSPHSPTSAQGMLMPPMLLYMDGSSGPQHYPPPPNAGILAEQLPRLPLTMSDLPRTHYDYTSRSVSPQDWPAEPPLSAASTLSTGSYHGAPSPAWDGGAPAFAPQSIPPAERPHEPYYHHHHRDYLPHAQPGPVYDRGGGAC